MEYKKLNVKRLVPPSETQKEIINKDKKAMPRNPIVRFIKLFFGEGF